MERLTMNMQHIIGSCDIVMIVLDTLRYDVAKQELDKGNLPQLAAHIDHWEQRHSPGSFTYAAHQAIFAGFFPTPVDAPLSPRPMAVSFMGSATVDENTYVFEQANIVEGLAACGYRTCCVGGVGFFNQQNPLGRVLPGLFQEAFWSEQMGVTDPNSTRNQIQKSLDWFQQLAADDKGFLFINVSAIHQPNYFYGDPPNPEKRDSIESHAAALRYVDNQLAALFDYCQQRRDTLFIICSDHGTCYGEDNYNGHRLAHEHVWTVPYAAFLQEAV